MKIFKLSVAYLFVLSLLLTSCSKDEPISSGSDLQDTFQIQFGTLLNDLSNQDKSHLSDDPVVCRDVDPSYVLVALTDSEGEWVDGKNPEADGANQDDFIKINIKNNGGSWETVYSDALGLPAGDYYLQYFIVYGTDGEVLWVAPREGGAYAGSVSDPLPQEISLGAGTKPYVEVDVLCYVPRMEEAYGYLFFDINAMAIENNYCLFVNYCDDETGREYPAKFSVDVWGDDYDGTEVIIDGEMNSVSGSGNSFAATVLCMALPPLVGDAVYYVRVTVLSAGAYTADASDIKEFTISQADIEAQLLATPRYDHLRINCDDTPPSGDPFCNPDGDGSSEVGCDFYCPGGIYGYLSEANVSASEQFIHVTPSNFGNTFKLYKDGTTTKIANLKFEFNNDGDLRVKFSSVQGTITAFAIDARLPVNAVTQRCRDTRCMSQCEHNDNFIEKLEADVITPYVLNNGGFYIKVKVQQGNCPS